MEYSLVICVLIVLSSIVSSVGSKRDIGKVWSFLLSMFLTPVIGLFLTYSSPLKEKENKHKEPIIVLIIAAGLMLAAGVWLISNGWSNWSRIKEETYLEGVGLKWSNTFMSVGSMYLGIGCFLCAVYSLWDFKTNKR